MDPDALTQAEARVRPFIEQGLKYQQIADQLVCTLNTIETHVQHIYRKLGVNSRQELIALSRRREPALVGPGAAARRER